MTWMVGIDEAGYGPNLGPFVMTSVACRLPAGICSTVDLWDLLRAAACRARHSDHLRLVVDDSKVIYSPLKGLLHLERNVLGCLGLTDRTRTIDEFVDLLSPESRPELRMQPWYAGDMMVPVLAPLEDLAPPADAFARESAKLGLVWRTRSVVVCPDRFNRIADGANSKGAVLATAIGELLRWNIDFLPGDDPLHCCADKHGGRNFYAATLQQGLNGRAVLARQESAACSTYEVREPTRSVAVTFRPRADQADFCVALASMTSKYLRELLMREFNRYWCARVPGLRPTAGYPGDAGRFYEAIRPAAVALGLSDDALWRRR
jgi:hypothetical protein